MPLPIFGNIGGMFSGFGGGNRKPVVGTVEGGLGIPQGFTKASGRRDTTRPDYFTANNTTAVTSGFTELGSLKVLAQQALRFGFSVSGNNDNQGLCFISLLSPNATQLDGYVRLVAKDANKFSTRVAKEYYTTTLRGSVTVRDQQVLLPEQPTSPDVNRDYVVQDEFLALDIKPDVAVSSGVGTEISTTKSSIVISTSQYFY